MSAPRPSRPGSPSPRKRSTWWRPPAKDSGSAGDAVGVGVQVVKGSMSRPQESQNLCPAGLDAAQCGQAGAPAIRAAHPPQDFAPSRFSWPQDGQGAIPASESVARPRVRKQQNSAPGWSICQQGHHNLGRPIAPSATEHPEMKDPRGLERVSSTFKIPKSGNLEFPNLK
jgi:hypothetical protein